MFATDLSTPALAATPGWLTRLNDWRAATGVSALTENTTWDQGDYDHSLYMVKDDQVTHYEVSTLPYYTVDGDTAARNGNIEVNSTTSFTDEQSIDWWMAAPFHAMGMMDPRLTSTGFGAYREIKTGWQAGFTLDVLRGNSFTGGNFPVYFPGNGSIVPLTTYGGNEFPDPLQACPGYSAPTGLPAFIEIGGNVSTAVTAHSFTGNGVALAHCVIDSTNPSVGSNLTYRGGVIVIPQQPLMPGVKYVVSLTVNGAAYYWSFGVTTSGSFSPSAPVAVNAVAGNGSATVTWGPPVDSGESAVASYSVSVYVGAAVVATRTIAAPTGSATFNGLTNGTTYWFSVAATNSIGTGPAASSNSVTPSTNGEPPPNVSFFSWFDNITPGMVGDNFHLLNNGAATADVTVNLPGAWPINVAVGAGQETYVTFAPGHIGGPVVVSSDQPVLASERVQYFQSFNEIWAMSSAQAATTLYVPWFDKATPGMVGDNIHVLNINSAPVTVIVSLPGAAPLYFSLGAGQETYVSFPPGTIGGPVTVQASQPVLAAQRVQYYQSFNEEVARPASQAQKLSYFNWFDKATAGMVGDNLHILNPGAQTASIRVSLAGASDIVFSLPGGAETYVTFPYGHIGGPVTVSSDQPVLASQRVQYYQSFNEVPQLTPAQAQTSNHTMWFDKATPGMVGDNIHILNPGTQTANVRVTLAEASDIVFSLPGGAETYVTFPYGSIGGPVTVSSDQPVLAAQRVQYFQTFNEVAAS